MTKALGATIATALVLAALASWPGGRANAVASPSGCDPAAPPLDPFASFERLAAAHVLDRDGLARERRLVEAARTYANARLNCTVDASDADWATSLWREDGRGWRVAFRAVVALIPDDPHVTIIGVDLDDDAVPVAANVFFR